MKFITTSNKKLENVDEMRENCMQQEQYENIENYLKICA